jgi:hypothetical protein
MGMPRSAGQAPLEPVAATGYGKTIAPRGRAAPAQPPVAIVPGPPARPARPSPASTGALLLATYRRDTDRIVSAFERDATFLELRAAQLQGEGKIFAGDVRDIVKTNASARAALLREREAASSRIFTGIDLKRAVERFSRTADAGIIGSRTRLLTFDAAPCAAVRQRFCESFKGSTCPSPCAIEAPPPPSFFDRLLGRHANGPAPPRCTYPSRLRPAARFPLSPSAPRTCPAATYLLADLS